MANISTATPTQLAELNNYVVQLRATISQFSINMVTMNAMVNAWNANISAIIGTPAGLTVTDSTGLAGAVPLTDTQVSTLVTDLQAILTTYYTTGAQQLYAEVCGPTNTF